MKQKHSCGSLLISLGLLLVAIAAEARAASRNVAYVYGDVSASGQIPSGGASPYDQMLLTDTGNNGCSQFRQMVEDEGYTISQHYDAATTLNAAFLNQFDVVIFGLHQKVWSVAEQDALDTWINAGGGILMYSDSASGGHYAQVGIQNTTGQMAVNSILTRYGMQVAVDHGAGTRSYTSPLGAANPVVSDQPVFEGEGVSPVAVDETTGAKVLIPCEDGFKVSGSNFTPGSTQNITIPYTRWAVLGHHAVGGGNVMAIFDRQPVWNNGPGSDINEEDNKEVLRRIVRFLANDYEYPINWLNLNFGEMRDPADEAEVWGWNADVDDDGMVTLLELAFNGDPMEQDSVALFPSASLETNPADSQTYLHLTYRQWFDGEGVVGVDYASRGLVYRVEYSADLQSSSWVSGASIIEQVGMAVPNGDGTESVTVRVLPAAGLPGQGFVRLNVSLEGSDDPLVVEAGDDRYLAQSGSAYLSGEVTGASVNSIAWTKLSGPGAVTFANASVVETRATFDAAGIYELVLTASNGVSSYTDTVMVEVFDPADVIIAINCGNTGTGHAGNNGFSYVADTLFTGGHADTFPGNSVENTDEDILYNYARSNHSSYNIPVADGSYVVLMQFSETFFTGVGSRVFDTSIEGLLVLDDLDLVAAAPGKWVAYDRAFEANVSDGSLTISHTASVNNALLNAIVVIQR